MGRLNLLGGQCNLLDGQMPTQLTCYLPPCEIGSAINLVPHTGYKHNEPIYFEMVASNACYGKCVFNITYTTRAAIPLTALLPQLCYLGSVTALIHYFMYECCLL